MSVSCLSLESFRVKWVKGLFFSSSDLAKRSSTWHEDNGCVCLSENSTFRFWMLGKILTDSNIWTAVLYERVSPNSRVRWHTIPIAFCFLSVPYGLAVRIPGFHPGGPGSTPGMGSFLHQLLLAEESRVLPQHYDRFQLRSCHNF